MQPRNFSTATYFMLVCAVSWPFQLAYAWYGEEFRPLLLVSMLMAGIATFVAGKCLFRDGFENAGWRLGRPRYWLIALLLPLFLWLLPLVLEFAFGWHPRPAVVAHGALLRDVALAFALTLLPAFGEEFSWRGYLLPRLLQRHSPRRALLLHGFFTWAWHLPVLVVLALGMDAPPVVALPLISLVPTAMHALVFAWLWAGSGSLLVATIYHAGFDEVRDTLQLHFAFGLLAEYWQALALTLLGAWILWRAPLLFLRREYRHE